MNHHEGRDGTEAASAPSTCVGERATRRRRCLGAAILVAAMIVASLLAAAPAGARDNGPPVERPYREITLIDRTIGECDSSSPPSLVCPFELSGTLIGTHIGRADDVGTGTATLDFSQSCVAPDGSNGTPVVAEFSGVIVASDGSELFYEGSSSQCFAGSLEGEREGSWWIVGGTGRFEGATGTIGLGPLIDGSAVNTGTITF